MVGILKFSLFRRDLETARSANELSRSDVTQEAIVRRSLQDAGHAEGELFRRARRIYERGRMDRAAAGSIGGTYA